MFYDCVIKLSCLCLFMNMSYLAKRRVAHCLRVCTPVGFKATDVLSNLTDSARMVVVCSTLRILNILVVQYTQSPDWLVIQFYEWCEHNDNLGYYSACQYGQLAKCVVQTCMNHETCHIYKLFVDLAKASLIWLLCAVLHIPVFIRQTRNEYCSARISCVPASYLNILVVYLAQSPMAVSSHEWCEHI